MLVCSRSSVLRNHVADPLVEYIVATGGCIRGRDFSRAIAAERLVVVNMHRSHGATAGNGGVEKS